MISAVSGTWQDQPRCGCGRAERSRWQGRTSPKLPTWCRVGRITSVSLVHRYCGCAAAVASCITASSWQTRDNVMAVDSRITHLQRAVNTGWRATSSGPLYVEADSHAAGQGTLVMMISRWPSRVHMTLRRRGTNHSTQTASSVLASSGTLFRANSLWPRPDIGHFTPPTSSCSF